MPARSRIVVAVCAASVATAAIAGCNSNGGADSSAPLAVPAATTSASPAGSAAPGKADPFSSMTADGIVSLAVANMRASGAMTVSMNAMEDGRTVQMKAALSSTGKCAAAMRVSGWNMQIVATDRTHVYMKADAGFWRASGGTQGNKLAKLVGDRWVKLTRKVLDRGNIHVFCSFNGFMGSVLSDGEGDGDTGLVKGAPMTLDGKQVVPLTEELTDETDTLYVSTGETPYIVRIEGKGGDSPGSGTFSDFGRPPHISAPPAAETLDMADLGIEPGNGISI